ncbi:MAG: hypothetical protein E7Z89_07980 [Cyanobacteria bacterium SIG28]|nr:hypothetical protein [Cyanobacteria bacterium SIG28]
MTSFWWQHNSRPSVRNFGDNCFYSDSDYKRFNRARYGSIWSGCGCCCNTGWRPSLRLGNFGCFGGWRGLNIENFKGGFGFGFGIGVSNIVTAGIGLLGGWLAESIVSGKWSKRKEDKPEKPPKAETPETRTPETTTKVNEDLEIYTALNKRANKLLAKADVTEKEIAALIADIKAVSGDKLLDEVQNDLDNENYNELLGRLNAKKAELAKKSEGLQPPGNDDNGSTPKEDLTTRANTVLSNKEATAEEIQGLIDEINELPEVEKNKYQELLTQLETKLGKLNKPDNKGQETVEEDDDKTTETDPYVNPDNYTDYDGKTKIDGKQIVRAVDIEGRKTGIRDVVDSDGGTITTTDGSNIPQSITLRDDVLEKDITYKYTRQDGNSYIYTDDTSKQEYKLQYKKATDEYVLVQHKGMTGSGKVAHSIEKKEEEEEETTTAAA